MTNRVLTAMHLDPATTLHDIRWGEWYTGDGVDDFVWVFEISGAAPASHFINGYAGARSERQPPMYFRLGGGTLKGISRPGEIVWSRIFIDDGALKMDLGRAGVVELPIEETQRRWDATTPCELVNSVINRPQPPWLRMRRRKTVSVTPAIGASTVAGATRIRPTRNSLGTVGIHKLF